MMLRHNNSGSNVQCNLFPGSPFFPFPVAPGEEKKGDPGNKDDVQHMFNFMHRFPK